MLLNSKVEIILLFQEYMSLSSQTKSKFKAKFFNKCLWKLKIWILCCLPLHMLG